MFFDNKISYLISVTTILISPHQVVTDLCSDYKSCGPCIAAQDCSWCQQRDYGDSRCGLLSDLQAKKCNSIVDPASSITYNKNEEPRNSLDGVEAIQLSPQEVTIKLRPNRQYEFPLHFKQARNFPVDLYFIMDLSHSMISSKEALASLSFILAKELKAFTENYLLGFGSFVDKTTLPFISYLPEHLPRTEADNRPRPYGFRNILSLTKNITEFQTLVNETANSGNLDVPEGGFDALMQVLACKDDIGWRTQSRKLILFTTDGTFHYAGDGKLGGVVMPNDGACHLNSTGHYTESTNLDYPSVSQLAMKIAEKKVNVIFCILQASAKPLALYKRLSELIEGSNVGVLTTDPNSIVNLVKENYERISGSIDLRAQKTDNFVVSFKSKCKDDQMKDRSVCDNIKVGESVMFSVGVEYKAPCSSDPAQWQKSFDIFPVGLTERLRVNVELMCECDCQLPEYEEPNSPECNTSGTYECGSCSCNQGFYGSTCQCGGVNADVDSYDDSCKMTNTSKVCQGHGDCECGVCICNPISPNNPNKKWTGPFCDCNNFNCQLYDEEMCGGPGRGYCECGKCRCLPGFEGSSCECPTSQESCRYKKTGEICNGKGDCVCGVCQCTADNGFYRGKTCEDCPSCAGVCEQHTKCIKCQFDSKDSPSAAAACNCTTVEFEDQVEAGKDWRDCKFRDVTDGCHITFLYNYQTNALKAQRTKDCPTVVDKRLITGGVIGGILLVGIIALLIWKLLVTLHDKQEFERFERERGAETWSTDNRLFKPSTTTYSNIAYNRSSKFGK